MKKLFFVLGVLFILIGVGLNYKDSLYDYFSKYLGVVNKDVKMEYFNEYYREYDFNFVKNTNDFIPKSKNDLYNIYYTIINSGNSEFTFYCTEDFDGGLDKCLNEVQNLSNDQTLLSDINNYVHPFNSFKNVSTEFDSLGRVTFSLVKSYSDEDIKLINNKVDELYSQLVDTNDTAYNNILKVHDYIINNSKYDSLRSGKNIINYKSDIAYGPLFEGYAICGGYTDLMQLFLERMNIKSFRVSSNEHVWNAVLLDNNWLNLDLTWDDPIVNDGTIDYLEHNFFLINTDKLLEIEKTEHNFIDERYSELVNN